jgi:hypothetical protein
VAKGSGGYLRYARRRLTLIAYRQGFREGQLAWRILWVLLMLISALRALRPREVLLTREVLQPGETVTIRQTLDTVGKRRK